MTFNLNYSNETDTLFELTKNERIIKSLSVKKSAQDLINDL